MLYPLYALATLMRDIHSAVMQPPGGFSTYADDPHDSLLSLSLPDPRMMVVDVSECGHHVIVSAIYAGGSLITFRGRIGR